MHKLARTSAFTALLIGLTSIASCAQAGPADGINTQDKAAVETIIREYLLENPEIIREALIALQEKEDRESITKVAKELRHDDRDYSVGPKDAKVTIVEFFDYNCSFCKKSTSWVANVIEEHPEDVRIVFKELPILDRGTQTSRMAAIAALSAGRQGRYTDMHFALMEMPNISEQAVKAAALNLGLNMTQFEKDRKDPALSEQIEDAFYLASRIPGLTGTPFFVINDEFKASGDTVALQRMLDKALEEAS